ncbi:MAG: DUF58 domain-containing protein [Bacteroidota bacterium]
MADSSSPALLTPDALARVESLELRARMVVEGFITGMHRSPFHGFSVEFAQHRAYNPGDDLRHVDWKVYARKERLFIKQYEEETNLRHFVVLDTSASMRYTGDAAVSKLEYGATLAGSLHVLMSKQRDATGLIAFDNAVHTSVPPKSTRSHVRGLLATLADLSTQPEHPGTETAAADVLHDVAERIPRRALVVVISDLFDTVGGADELVKALRHLRHRGHEIVVFHVLDAATERRFDVGDAPVRFRDLETGEERTLQPAQLRAGYREAAEAFLVDVQRRCLEVGADYVPLDTARPYSDALRAYLDKRRRLY